MKWNACSKWACKPSFSVSWNPAVLKIMPQNTPTVYDELKIWRYTHVRCYLNVHVNWPVAFFPLVKQRESRSSLDLSAMIFIHVGCSIRHPSIPFENCLKRLTYRRAEKTQIHRIDKKRLALHVVTRTFHAIKILRKCFLLDSKCF